MMSELRSAKNEQELAALHDLRDAVLFRGRGNNAYNRQHPSDSDPNNHFMGFWDGATLIGTVRIDFIGDQTAIMRLVAIHPEKRGRGAGRAMLLAAEQYAAQEGCVFAVTNAVVGSADFYMKLGYVEHAWKDPAFAPPQVPVVQMRKVL